MITQDIYIQAGSTFTRTITLTNSTGQPFIVSGYTANANLKRDLYSANDIPIPFETQLANGSLLLRLEANTTANMWPGTWVYDAVISNGNTTYRVADGEADVDGGITGITLFANT